MLGGLSEAERAQPAGLGSSPVEGVCFKLGQQCSLCSAPASIGRGMRDSQLQAERSDVPICSIQALARHVYSVYLGFGCICHIRSSMLRKHVF